MAQANSVKMASFKYDLSAAGLLGAMAGVFASIIAANLGVLDKTVAGLRITPVIIFIGFVVLCLAGIMVARLLEPKIGFLYQFGKFGEAGGLNWLVDLGVLNLLILVTGQSAGLYFVVFKAISFIVAVTNSYFWNKIWVFWGAKDQDRKQEVGKFVIASLLGLGLNVLLASTIAFMGPNIVSSVSTKLWANIATIFGSLSAMIFNFVLYKIWVFKD